MGKTTLDRLAATLKGSKFLITNDTGTMHIAAALDVKIICIALATAYSHETSPYSEGNYIIEADIECTPCSSKIVCTNPICKSYIKPSHIFEIVSSVINQRDPELSHFDGVKLFKTKFDLYDNLTIDELTSRDKNRPFRELFYHLIYNCLGEENFQLVPLDDQKISKIGKILRSTLDCSVYSSLIEGVNLLIEKASVGLNITNKMEILFKNECFVELSNLAKEIEDLDNIIVGYGLSNMKLRLLTFMFQIEKENIDSDDTKLLIEYTSKTYSLLLNRSKILLEIINDCLGRE
jgi:hypothetical protein